MLFRSDGIGELNKGAAGGGRRACAGPPDTRQPTWAAVSSLLPGYITPPARYIVGSLRGRAGVVDAHVWVECVRAAPTPTTFLYRSSRHPTARPTHAHARPPRASRRTRYRHIADIAPAALASALTSPADTASHIHRTSAYPGHINTQLTHIAVHPSSHQQSGQLISTHPGQLITSTLDTAQSITQHSLDRVCCYELSRLLMR